MIIVAIEMSEYERGTVYWKFNTQLLARKDFVQKMNVELQKTINLVESKDKITAWAIIKRRIKNVSSQYSRQNAGENTLIIGQLAEKVNK